MSGAYYNEFDKYAAQWLRNLIAAGHIAPGDVDERDIRDVKPYEIAKYTQHHFFAGVGVWSYALRAAGWSDSERICTASCPCQPFSAAGAGAGFADERHLWPDLFHLITQLRPAKILGEQVASKDANPWLDLVQTDLETVGYAFGAVAFPSAGVGAPHIRDRAYWVANTDHAGSQRWGERGHGGRECVIGAGGVVGGLADAIKKQRGWQPDSELLANGQAPGWQQSDSKFESNYQADRLPTPGPTNGFWRASDWVACTDDKWRPVEPGTQPLANGIAARVGRLRAYGNAINAEAARIFIECAVM